MFRFCIRTLGSTTYLWTGKRITSEVIEKLVEKGFSTENMVVEIHEVD